MEYKYGGFWRRFAAFFIDGIILFIVFTLLFIIGIVALRVSSPFSGSGFSLLKFTRLTVEFLIMYHLAMGLVSMLYFTYFHGTVGQTPGKMILKLKVLQVSGEELNLGIGFLRWVGYIVSALVFHLGFIWIALDRKKRGWHDRIAGTIVVRQKNTVPELLSSCADQ